MCVSSVRSVSNCVLDYFRGSNQLPGFSWLLTAGTVSILNFSVPFKVFGSMQFIYFSEGYKTTEIQGTLPDSQPQKIQFAFILLLQKGNVFISKFVFKQQNIHLKRFKVQGLLKCIYFIFYCHCKQVLCCQILLEWSNFNDLFDNTSIDHLLVKNTFMPSRCALGLIGKLSATLTLFLCIY